MSLVHHCHTPDFCWGLWKIEEHEDATFFKQHYRWHLEEEKAINNVTHPAKKLQKYAARACFKSLLEDAPAICTDPKGKPHPASGGYLSLSHSDVYASAIFSPYFPVAIDVERIDTERSFRSAKMFMNAGEKLRLEALNDHRYFYLLWCIKECLFKVLNRYINEISFQRHLYTVTTQPDFQVQSQGTVIVGCRREDFLFESEAQYLIWEDYMLAYLCSPLHANNHDVV